MILRRLTLAVMLGVPVTAHAQATPVPPDFHAPPHYKVKPEVLDSLMNQALQRINKGQLQQAARILRHCIAVESRYPPCHRGLAMVYDHQGAVKKAMAENRIFLRLTHQPDDSLSVQSLMLPMLPALLGGPSLDDDD